MSTVTDSGLQQLKDLITAGQLATQKQIADLNKKMEVGFANFDTKFAHLEGKINTLSGELSIIQSNQKGQDTRFWSLVFLILTTFIRAICKLAKFY